MWVGTLTIRSLLTTTPGEPLRPYIDNSAESPQGMGLNIFKLYVLLATAMPAQLTATSTRPNFSLARVRAACTSFSEVTFKGKSGEGIHLPSHIPLNLAAGGAGAGQIQPSERQQNCVSKGRDQGKKITE